MAMRAFCAMCSRCGWQSTWCYGPTEHEAYYFAKSFTEVVHLSTKDNLWCKAQTVIAVSKVAYVINGLETKWRFLKEGEMDGELDRQWREPTGQSEVERGEGVRGRGEHDPQAGAGVGVGDPTEGGGVSG